MILDRIFVAHKPTGLSSNQFLSRIKRKYKVKKAGYSGTLDPFAKGVLIIALGNYGRLFRFLKKTPKTYIATLWLGAYSPTLDIEKIESLEEIPPFDADLIKQTIESFKGNISYYAPKYSAKHINGKRAYELAREGKEMTVPLLNSTIHEISLIHYSHPFITFKATVSEGTYIRSIGHLISKKLGCDGSLSSLERTQEGQSKFDNETIIDIKNALSIPKNTYNGDTSTILLGKKLSVVHFENQTYQTFWIDLGSTISILNIDETGVHYILNNIPINAKEY